MSDIQRKISSPPAPLPTRAPLGAPGQPPLQMTPPEQLFQRFTQVSDQIAHQPDQFVLEPYLGGSALNRASFEPTLQDTLSVAVNTARQEWDKGVTETRGKPNRGKDVDKYARAIGGSLGQEWCGYFIGYCYQEAGFKDPIALASTYRARKFFGEPNSGRQLVDVSDTNQPDKKRYSYDQLPIQSGDVVIFNEGKQSHLAMVESYDPATGMLTTLEGNSGGGSAKLNDGSDTEVVRNGNAVVRKSYNLSLKHIRAQITGFGRPSPDDFEKPTL